MLFLPYVLVAVLVYPVGGRLPQHKAGWNRLPRHSKAKWTERASAGCTPGEGPCVCVLSSSAQCHCVT
jgi:hypothetical protein